MKAYKVLIFDWDGTLADSTAQIVQSVQAAFVAVDLPPPSAEAASHIIGLALDKAMQYLLPEADAATIAKVGEQYKLNYLRSDNKNQLFSDATQLLPTLKNDFWLTVATGKSRTGLNRALLETNTQDLMLTTRTVDECPSKPHPEMILSICDELGVHPKDVLMIGDTTHDLLMAKNAGADAVALTTGAHPEAILREAPFITLQHSFGQFVDWLYA